MTDHQAARKDPAKGSQLVVRGQIEPMNSSFRGLLAGLALAIVLVYLLIVVNFHRGSTRSSSCRRCGGAVAGIVWMLFVTHTTFGVPA